MVKLAEDLCGFKKTKKCKDCNGYGFTNYGKGRDIQTFCLSCNGTGFKPKDEVKP